MTAAGETLPSGPPAVESLIWRGDSDSNRYRDLLILLFRPVGRSLAGYLEAAPGHRTEVTDRERRSRGPHD